MSGAEETGTAGPGTGGTPGRGERSRPGPAGGREAGTAEPRPGRTAEGRVDLDAPADRVWRALTEARELERWFPLEARVEPGVGGSLWMSWRNEYEWASEIRAWEPGRHLRISWGGPEEAGEPAQVTDYFLEGAGGRTVLRVVTSGFPEDASWDDWVEATRKGWIFELESLRHYLERHAGRDRRVIYLRRRVEIGPDAAWSRLFGPDGLGDRPLGGEPFDHDPPLQYASVASDPAGALFRASLEPCHGIPGTRDVTLWLQAWGADDERMAGLETEWSSLLERLFPGGSTP